MKSKKIIAILLSTMCVVATLPATALASSGVGQSRPATDVYTGKLDNAVCEELVSNINGLIDSGNATLEQINKNITEISSMRDKIDRSALEKSKKEELSKLLEPASVRLAREKARLDSALILLEKFKSSGLYTDYSDAYSAITVCESSATRQELVKDFFTKADTILGSYSDAELQYIVKQFVGKVSAGEMTKDDAYKAIEKHTNSHLVSDSKDKIYKVVTPAELSHLVSDANVLVKTAVKSKTTEDIYLARISVNGLPECQDKDDLMKELDGIVIDGLTRKSATNYLDILLKAENTIQLDLSTSSIVFEGYNGTEDIVKPEAVVATVSSSLPYDLGITMEKPIKGQETGLVIPDNNLQVRKTKDGAYVPMSVGTRYDIIKNSPRGKNMQYPLDMKVLADSSVKADHYKTVLKFQAEQI